MFILGFTPDMFGRKAVLAIAEILTKAADARKMALSLKNVQYGGELLQQLMACSTKLEAIHGKLQDLVSRSKEGENEAKLLKLMELAEDQCNWFTKAKA